VSGSFALKEFYPLFFGEGSGHPILRGSHMKYSNCREINDEVMILIKEGWRAERGGKHWKLFSPCGKMRNTIPGSPSDHRSYLNWKRDIKRLQNGQKIGVNDMEYTPKPQTDISQFKNGPRVLQKNLQPKVFDDFAFELTKKLKEEEKKSYDQIAVILNEQNYVDQKHQKMNSWRVSSEMVKRGYQRRFSGKNKKVQEAQVAEKAPTLAPLVTEKEHSILHEVLELVTSNLSNVFKERHLLIMAREWHEKGLLK
jgi:hypothetical protein